MRKQVMSIASALMFALFFAPLLPARTPVLGQTVPSADAQAVKLEDLLKANSYELKLSDGNLSASGLDFLLKATAKTQFFAVGEPHNAKEVPELTALLFKALKMKHAFNYLALEQDPITARMVSAPTVAGSRDYVISLARKYPNAFTFITDQELEMIGQVASISNGKGNRVWGLDQVFGATNALDRLSQFAPNADVRRRTSKLVEVLKRNEAERAKTFQRYTIADAGATDEFTDLLREYRPKANSEADFLVSQMLLSAQIYKNNRAAGQGQLTGYDSNLEREENMKALFMLEYRKAQAAGDALPKVLLKFGHYHAIRGRSWSNVLSLGNFISEFAKSNDMNSFHLAVYNNNAAGDYGVLASTPDYKPFADAVPKDKWTIVDLRPLRAYAHAGKLPELNPELRRAIFGFDAALFIGGASRGTYKMLGAQ